MGDVNAKLFVGRDRGGDLMEEVGEGWEGAGAELGLRRGEEGGGLGSPFLGFRGEEGEMVLEMGGGEGVLRGGEGAGGGGEDAAPPASPGLLLGLGLGLGGMARRGGWRGGRDSSRASHGKGRRYGVNGGLQLGIDVARVPAGGVGVDAIALDVWAAGFEGLANGAAGGGGAGRGRPVGSEEVKFGEDIFLGLFGLGGVGAGTGTGGDGGGGDVCEEVVEDVGGFGHG